MFGAEVQRVLTHVAERPLTMAAATKLGVSPQQLSVMTQTGLLVRPFRGVYLSAEQAATVQGRAAALSSVLPPEAVACRRTAAWLLGFDTASPGDHSPFPPLECMVPTGVEPASRPGVHCYSAPLCDEDVVYLGSVRSTTPARTALDLARYLPGFMGLAVVDAMAHEGLIDPTEVLELAHRFSGDRNIAKARRLILWCEPLTESYGESWMRLRILEAGFPHPEAQIKILWPDGTLRYRLDLGYPDRRRAWEYDGEQFHTEHEDRDKDAKRRQVLKREHAWDVTPIYKGDVLGRSMDLELSVGEALGTLPSIVARKW